MKPFLRYLRSKYKAEDRRDAYQIYVTDMLRAMTGANYRFADIAYKTDTEAPEPEEVISGLKKKLSALRKE